ncbi:MAG: DNA recombination protein RmuC [Bdellovibrionales bacterium]|nr:DNA recombination protein RmuC [Bdellovibrionales bacterium]
MILYIALGLMASLVLVLGFFVWRQKQGTTVDPQQRVLENLDRLQQNLSQRMLESENSYEHKASLLRTELAEAIQKSRLEMQQVLGQTSQLLEQKVSGVDQKLDRKLGELSQGVQSKLEANLKEGFSHFQKVHDHLSNLSVVGQSINDLNNLLKLPHLRGNFGEASLERILADLLPVSAYETQYRIVPTSTERVDAVIKYPRRVLPIDSKFPREQVLPLFETNDPGALEKSRSHLADIMKTLARQIREKYIHPEYGTTDMALLFVPSETLYFEVIRNVKLCEAIAKQKVFAVSPNTLAISLHAVSMARDYYEMAKGVEKTLEEVKKAQKHFENFEKRFEEIGKQLKRSQDAFDTASTHLGRYSGAANRLVGGTPPLSPSESDTPRRLAEPPTV